MLIRVGILCPLLVVVAACSTATVEEPAEPAPAAVENENTPDVTPDEPTKFVALNAEQAGPGARGEGAMTPAVSPAAEIDLAILIRAVEEVRTTMNELKTQQQLIMDHLGVQPSATATPPATSLTDKVLDVQEAVRQLVDENLALRTMIEQQVTALKPSLQAAEPTDGTLVVDNNTDEDHYMWVNGTGRWIWARSQLRLQVPLGSVTTKLAGESAKTWDIKGPKYEEHIEIFKQ